MMRSDSVALVLAAHIVLADSLFEVQTRDHDDHPFKYFNFVKDHSLIACVPAKCGTTSFYRYIYRAVFGEYWPYENDPPWISDLFSSRWNNTWSEVYLDETLFHAARRKIAVVRDPIERLLSGWKSKLACDNMVEGHFSDKADRERLVPHIFEVARMNGPHPECISFEKYVNLLKRIHDAGHVRELDRHFLPQQYMCFDQEPIDHWDVAVPISSPALRRLLGDIFDTPHLQMPHDHVSTAKGVWVHIGQRTRSIMNSITRAEYAALGNSLSRGRTANVHGTATLECDNAACGVPCTQDDGACVTW